jgi:glycosyltransferase involved in cell wall biosynthesis
MPVLFPESWSNLNAVLSHDWLTGMRGGEKCLELLCQGFPNAPVYTLLHKEGSMSEAIASHPIQTSALQNIPGITSTYRYFLPFFPMAMAGLKAQEADLMVSTSHCVAKALRPQPGTKHLCYCFTPMRYAWTFYEEYFGDNPVKAAVLKPVLAGLRNWDHKASDRVDRFVAISKHVQERIKRFYERESDIVYPPVDTGFYDVAMKPVEPAYDLVVSALVPYKRVDLAVRAYSRMGYPLKVVGTGTESEKLRSMAGPNIEFLGYQTNEQIRTWYQECRHLVFPGEEDFGIVPVEVQACGRPVIAYRKGGALETVVEDVSGLFFNEQTEKSLAEAVEDAAAKTWNPTPIRLNAEKFSIQHYIDGLDQSIQTCLKN